MDQNKNNAVVVGKFAPPARRLDLSAVWQTKFLLVAGPPLTLMVVAGVAYAVVFGPPKAPRNTLPAVAHTQKSPSTAQPGTAPPSTAAGSKANATAPSSKTAAAPSPSDSSGSGGTSNPTTSFSSGGGTTSGGAGSTESSAATWVGDFASGTLKGWLNQSCPGPSPPAGVTLGTTPAGSGGTYAAAFTVSDQSTDVYCPPVVNSAAGTVGVPTGNPRAQLVGPSIFTNNSNWYIGFSTYFPASFPATTSWFQFAEIYGKPWGGSPSMGFGVKGSSLTLDRDPTHNYDTIWSTPMQRGIWENIIAHVQFSTCGDNTAPCSAGQSPGYVELWLNGVQQHFTDGSTRVYYDTLVPGVNWDGSTPNDLTINQYRNVAAPMGTVTIYHAEAKAGPTYSSVLP